MAETIGLGDSVSVEVTRAGGFKTVVAGPGASTASPESAFIILGVLIVVAVLCYFLWRRMSRSSPRSKGVALFRSIGIASIVGFAGFMVSASPASWVLAAGVFFHQFFVKSA